MLDAGSEVWQRNSDILETWATIAATVDDVASPPRPARLNPSTETQGDVASRR